MNIDTSKKDCYEYTLNGLKVCVDWTSFTFNFTDGLTASDAMEFLGFNPENFIKMPKGANGYKSLHVLSGDNIRILSDGKPDMGIHVDISGTAIASLLSAWQKKHSYKTPFGEGIEYQDINYSSLLDCLDAISQFGTFTRLDLAIDDIGCNYFSCDDIKHMIETQCIVSKFRKYHTIQPRSLTDGNEEGYTIYLGSRKSEVMLRIYDKQLEYIHKHGVDCTYPWIRWELELKNDRANEAVNQLLETHSISTVCIGILRHYVRFVVPDNHVKSLCSSSPIWEAFINNMKDISLYVPDAPKNIEDTKRWVDKYVGASLSAIIEADGGSLEFIYNNLPKWRLKREQNRDLTRRLLEEINKERKASQSPIVL